ncbi:MAG: hypothetical protein LBR54_04400 [Oscillospiraceae bacterium]|jgi:DNA primase|nr:hypothetical protein [Oscillospiraceae bacterium]
MQAFELLKQQLDIRTVMEDDGIAFNRSCKALCPFHSEKTPSFTVYKKTNTFKCFGCGAYGSVIDYIMRTRNYTALESARFLDERYGLQLFSENKTSREQAKKYYEDKKLV